VKALVLEKAKTLSLRDYPIVETVGPGDVRVKIERVGICGSDVHYYTHGRIGDFVVREPMILGHEASGTILELGFAVKGLAVGDRVCMEPGIPDFSSRESKMGLYNVDPTVSFWATPPVHGCMRETVVHPAGLVYRLPENVSLDEGALVEPLAIGVHAAKKARVAPGDTAVVTGAGTIGAVTAMAAIAAGCSRVIISDTKKEKLEFIRKNYGGSIIPIDVSKEDLGDAVARHFPGGADILFEASGNPTVIVKAAAYLKPAGRVVLIGIPQDPAPIDICAAQAKEIEFLTIFRYANVWDRTVNFISSGKINVKPLITKRFSFSDAIKAFEYAASGPSDSVKIMIEM
jgi:D-xylulose reductase